MPDPIEIIPEEPDEAVPELEIASARAQPPNSSLDTEQLTEGIIHEEEESLIEPQSRLGFAKRALTAKIQELTRSPKEAGMETLEKSKDVLENHGATFLHSIPGLGVLFALFAKRQAQKSKEESIQQFKSFNNARLQSLSASKRSILDYPRGIDPIQYAKNPEIQASELLANSCEYAQRQIQKRMKSLNIKDLGSDLQIIGATAVTSVVAAPVGLGVSVMGSILKAFTRLKSIGTFVRKVWNQTLGIERTRHAQVLFGLALLDSRSQWPEGLVLNADVRDSLELLQECGVDLSSTPAASQKASELLRSLGLHVPKANTGPQEFMNFARGALPKIKDRLKT